MQRKAAMMRFDEPPALQSVTIAKASPNNSGNQKQDALMSRIARANASGEKILLTFSN
jgi:hypothetical protein